MSSPSPSIRFGLNESDYERFTAKIDRLSQAPCWIWTGGKTGSGYGSFSLPANGSRRSAKAHRIAYELWTGPIPEGLNLDHLCRNRDCVNPAHLEPVTHTENCRRGIVAKVDEDAVRHIRAELTEPIQRLMKQYGISDRQLMHIVARKSWKDVA